MTGHRRNGTELTRDQATSILAQYSIALQTSSPLSGGFANSSNLIGCPDGSHVVLTILDNHNRESAEALANLTDWLIDNGVNTPAILRTRPDENFVMLGSTPCIVRPYVQGAQPAHLSSTQAESVGQALRQLHELDPPPNVQLPMRRLPGGWRQVVGSDAPVELTSLLLSAEAVVQALAPETPKRIVHGDLFPDNMMWTSEGLVLLDWETAALDHPVLDIGFTAVGFSAEGSLNNELLDSLLGGYGSPGFDRDEIYASLLYACAVLTYHRYARHVIRYPDPSKFDHWRKLLVFADSLHRPQTPIPL